MLVFDKIWIRLKIAFSRSLSACAWTILLKKKMNDFVVRKYDFFVAIMIFLLKNIFLVIWWMLIFGLYCVLNVLLDCDIHCLNMHSLNEWPFRWQNVQVLGDILGSLFWEEPDFWILGFQSDVFGVRCGL